MSDTKFRLIEAKSIKGLKKSELSQQEVVYENRLQNTKKALDWLVNKRWVSFDSPNVEVIPMDNWCSQMVICWCNCVLHFQWSDGLIVVMPREEWIDVRMTTTKVKSISHTQRTGGEMIAYYQGVSLYDSDRSSIKHTLYLYKSVVRLHTRVPEIPLMTYEFFNNEQTAAKMEAILRQGISKQW
jgi:hypothetical protein